MSFTLSRCARFYLIRNLVTLIFYKKEHEVMQEVRQTPSNG